MVLPNWLGFFGFSTFKNAHTGAASENTFSKIETIAQIAAAACTATLGLLGIHSVILRVAFYNLGYFSVKNAMQKAYPEDTALHGPHRSYALRAATSIVALGTRMPLVFSAMVASAGYKAALDNGANIEKFAHGVRDWVKSKI